MTLRPSEGGMMWGQSGFCAWSPTRIDHENAPGGRQFGGDGDQGGFAVQVGEISTRWK